MSHHTDLAGVDVLVSSLQPELEQVLVELRVRDAERYAHGEPARNYLRELIVATRRNDPLHRAQRQFCGILPGEAGRSVLLLAFLRRVQQDAYASDDERRTLPLPRGVATPVPDYDDDRTPIPGPPVDAKEVDATRPLTPKPTRGPWDKR